MKDEPPRPLDIVPVPVQPPPISINTGHHFVTEAKEESKDCERSGKYVSPTKKLKSDCTGTRKCGCPFRLRGYYTKETKLWHMRVVNGIHKHELDTELEGHLVAGRLKPEDKVFLDEMTKNFVPPRNINSTLKDRDPENTMSSKQVCNARYRYKAKIRAFMSEMQHLFKHLGDNKYFFKCRSLVDEGGEYLQDLFFAHSRSVSLLNSFPTVLLMDSTYKTNKYNMPLFEIVGFTSTERTYNVGFAWLTNEKEDNFIWALQQLRSLVRNEGSLPKVILTDRDTALMNVVAQVFPTSAVLVCRVHVEKNVGSKIKELVKVRQGEEFRELCKKWPRLLRYIEETVLDTDKEKVVHAWVDKHMHMGNYTTNRVECAHGVLKKFLTDSSGDLVKAFKVSRAALDYIYQEAKRVDNVGMDCKKCGCLMRVNYGLPCACLIAKKLRHNQPIRLDEVYNHWKRLCFNNEEVGGDVQDDYSCTAEWEEIKQFAQKQFEELMSIERGDVSTVGVGSKDNPMTIQ
ncbi:hypothetical protein TSUD_272430 [Trifolium subterraneum]|uniref:MULE transposase domain-containing protein n=1 Tax=Trifolium subterraneum TaxID=3900 RepID=A0A2Z6PBA3_TRISU|nr:hypothetical protein TSUD_272430 [Trifolium subterraneum]